MPIVIAEIEEETPKSLTVKEYGKIIDFVPEEDDLGAKTSTSNIDPRIDPSEAEALTTLKKTPKPKPEEPKPETPKPETPKPEPPKPETPKPEPPKPVPAPKPEPKNPKPDAAKKKAEDKPKPAPAEAKKTTKEAAKASKNTPKGPKVDPTTRPPGAPIAASTPLAKKGGVLFGTADQWNAASDKHGPGGTLVIRFFEDFGIGYGRIAGIGEKANTVAHRDTLSNVIAWTAMFKKDLAAIDNGGGDANTKKAKKLQLQKDYATIPRVAKVVKEGDKKKNIPPEYGFVTGEETFDVVLDGNQNFVRGIVKSIQYDLIYDVMGHKIDDTGGTKPDGAGATGIPAEKATWAKEAPIPWYQLGYKNHINWAFMEERTTGWGGGQPTGVFIVDGKQYGAKVKQGQVWGPYIVEYRNGTKAIVDANKIWDDNSYTVTDQNIKTAVRGFGGHAVLNGVVAKKGNTAGAATPFFGLCDWKGKRYWFAGQAKDKSAGNSLPKFGEAMVACFKEVSGNDPNTKILDLITSDAGGSPGISIDGKPLTIFMKRNISTIIYW